MSKCSICSYQLNVRGCRFTAMLRGKTLLKTQQLITCALSQSIRALLWGQLPRLQPERARGYDRRAGGRLGRKAPLTGSAYRRSRRHRPLAVDPYLVLTAPSPAGVRDACHARGSGTRPSPGEDLRILGAVNEERLRIV